MKIGPFPGQGCARAFAISNNQIGVTIAQPSVTDRSSSGAKVAPRVLRQPAFKLGNEIAS